MPQRDELIDEIQKTDLLLEYAVLHGEVEEAERLRAKLRHLAAMGDRDECIPISRSSSAASRSGMLKCMSVSCATMPGFECQCCGACCRIKDGIVRVSDREIARIAAYLGMREDDFIARETEIAPDRKTLMLKSRSDGACVYLTDDNRCRIHEVKPDKCRTFPFEWTNADSHEICPGLGRASGI